MTREEKTARFIEEICEKIKTSEESPLTLRSSTSSRLDVVLKKCGFRRRSASILQQLQTCLEGAGVFPQPLLTDPDLDYRQKIYFSRRRPRERTPRGMLFHAEMELEHFVIENFDKIEQLSGLKIVKSQFLLDSGRRVDILCRDKLNGDYVVIELKNKDADDGVLGQILSYMKEIEKTAKKEGKKVHGIIITGQRNSILQEIIENSSYPIDWLVYSAGFSVEPA